jgi:hypothetical protein
MTYLCSHWAPNVQIVYFIFDWSIYRLFLLNRGRKRDSIQMMISVYVCTTCSVVELKKRFETWITRKDVNDVNLFLFSYLITVMPYLCSQWATNIEIRYFTCDWSICRLFVLNTRWKRDSLQMKTFVNVCSTCCVVERKTLFETWITINDVNGVNLFLLSYLITLTTYLCSQCAPIVQIKYFMFDWSIYRLFVLNRCWKRDSLEMMIFVYVCSTSSVVELKTRLESWNEVNGVYASHIS